MHTRNKKQKGVDTQKQPHLTELLTNLQNQASTRSYPQYTILPNYKIDTKKNFLKNDLNIHNFERLSSFFPSKWTKKSIMEQPFKPFFFFYQQESLPNSRENLSPKGASPTVHQIKQKLAATKYELSGNEEEYEHSFLLPLCTCSIY